MDNMFLNNKRQITHQCIQANSYHWSLSVPPENIKMSLFFFPVLKGYRRDEWYENT